MAYAARLPRKHHRPIPQQQIISLLEYATLFQDFLENFPDKFNSLEGRMRELANEAEDILEYLVLEKFYLSSDEESHQPDRDIVLNDLGPKLRKLFRERHQGFPDNLEGRYCDAIFEALDIRWFLDWEKDHIRLREKQKDHIRLRDKQRFLPAKFAKFKSRHYFSKIRDEFDSILRDLMAFRNNKSLASSSGLAPADMIGLHDDYDDDDEESECYRSAEHELQLERVMEEIALVAAQVKGITDSSSGKDVQPRAHSSTLSSSPTAPRIHEDSMVGFEDQVLDVKGRLCGESSRLQVIPICAMGGIGKTTLARNVYHSPLIVESFVIRVWVTISQDYSAQRILSSLVESLKEFDTGDLGEGDDEKLHKILMGRRYLVVMDDMWSTEAWDVVRRVFPDDNNGSRVILTTRLSDVASYPDPSSKLHEMSLLNAYQSWNMLKQKVFANQDCPSDLENIGEEIARSCKGLPLAIVVVAGLLSTVGENRASWLEIAEKVKSAETAKHDQIEEILSLSYVELPQHLRPCFLYMASFPEDHEIHAKKLIRLWLAEGFLKYSSDSQSFEKVAEECLDELVKRNLVLVTKRKRNGGIRSCSLHDLMRDMCITKAHESKFFLNLMDRHIEKEHFTESIKDERRVSVDSSYLSYLSSCGGSAIHSIKCSKYHIVKLDFVEGVRLLRVLDADSADVDSFPSQLCELSYYI